MTLQTTRRSLAARLPAALAFVVVLAAYAFFGSVGKFQWNFGQETGWYYSKLSEGFLRGHLSLSVQPDPALQALPNPWDAAARLNIPYEWDASYYNGKYYLYFTPLPALIFYIPIRLLTGRYPADPVAASLFTCWAFAMWVAFAARALGVRERKPVIPFPLIILILGLGNMIPFVLDTIRTYEVAITCAMALAATWSYALLRFVESPTRRGAAWMGVWLALAVAARPNLVVLVAVAALAVWRAGADVRERFRLAVPVLLPLAVAGAASAWYNYARFGSPFEVGLSYQLTLVSMQGRRVCSLCSWSEGGRLLNSALQYVFMPPTIWRSFPFVMMENNILDPGLAYPGVREAVIGIAALNPITLIGTLAAAVLAVMPVREPRIRASLYLLAGGWLVLIALSTCWWIVARYEIDFIGPITLGAIVACDHALTMLRRSGVATLPLRIGLALIGCYAVVMGLILGIYGPGGAFRAANPELYSRIAKLFS